MTRIITSHAIRSFTLTIAVLAGDALTACNPCESDRFGVTDVIVNGPPVCHDEGDGADAGGTDDASAGEAPTTDEGDTVSGSEGSNSGSEGETEGPFCMPPPGADWGPCNIDGACPINDGACMMTDDGSLCAPACPGVCPATVGQCGGGGMACVVGAFCLPECEDASDCPNAAMLCSPALGLSFCVWPD